jgi:hypothetical protein
MSQSTTMITYYKRFSLFAMYESIHILGNKPKRFILFPTKKSMHSVLDNRFLHEVQFVHNIIWYIETMKIIL